MTKLQRERQLEKRKNIAACVIVGAMATGALLFCNALGSTGDNTPEEITVLSDRVPAETEMVAEEIEIACVDIEIVEQGTEEPETEEVAEIEEKEVETTTKSYSEDDVNRLAHLIYAEVGSNKNSDMLLYACGQVLLNRVASKKFPNSIVGCINQKSQYSTRKTYMKLKPTERCFRIARELLEGKKVVPTTCYGQSFKGTFKRYGKKCYYKENGVYIYSLK